MSRIAPVIHTDPERIAALQALLPQLPDLARVQVELSDGRRLLGTVAVRPTVQQYLDAEGNEGSNGQLRLDDLDQPVQQHVIWLDTITSIRQLPPITP